MDTFDSLPCNMFGKRDGWTMILRITQWLQELERMIPDEDAREEWQKANCSSIRHERDPLSGRFRQMLYMKRDAFQQLLEFKEAREELRRAAYLNSVNALNTRKEIEQ